MQAVNVLTKEVRQFNVEEVTEVTFEVAILLSPSSYCFPVRHAVTALCWWGFVERSVHGQFIGLIAGYFGFHIPTSGGQSFVV